MSPASSIRGLSPRVRGNPIDNDGRPWRIGSIPACTGEPGQKSSPTRSKEVYPRVYGGTHILSRIEQSIDGLSPRVRGNQRHAPALLENDRSIPACTGEPLPSGPMTTSPRVYPRVYGGTRRPAQAHGDWLGLSPRVRGNPVHIAQSMVPYGSIPACTGEPLAAATAALVRAVYPRVYGGTITASTIGTGTAGLSPRVRGNRSGSRPR